MLIDETIYAEKRVKQFMSDTMVGSVKEDRRCRGKQQGQPKSHEIAIRVPITGLGAGVEESLALPGSAKKALHTIISLF